jgi:hypothetical protein
MIKASDEAFSFLETVIEINNKIIAYEKINANVSL